MQGVTGTAYVFRLPKFFFITLTLLQKHHQATMRFQPQATKVLERTSHYIKVGLLKKTPAWYDVVGAFPPHIDVTKRAKSLEVPHRMPDPDQSLHSHDNQGKFYKTRSNKEDRSQKNNAAFRIPKLEFLEDELRNVFYHQHPWEFSRPKTLVENTGDDNSTCDWSRMLQLSKPLDGELVVQRTVWLMNDAKVNGDSLDISAAYDKARFEFYQLRMQDEMNSSVLREESSMYGAVQSATHADLGIAVEQKFIDTWAKDALERTKIQEATQGRLTALVGVDDMPAAEGAIWETDLGSVEETKEIKK